MRAQVAKPLGWGVRAETEDGHPSCNARLHSRRGVLDYDALSRRRAELTRCEQIDVWRRFAARNLRDAEQSPVESRQQARQPERHVHLFMISAGGDAVWRAEMIQRVLNARHRRKAAAERLERSRLQVAREARRRRAPQHALNDLEAIRDRISNEVFEDLRLRQVQSKLAEHVRQHAIRNRFAVYEYAVAIEDHQVDHSSFPWLEAGGWGLEVDTARSAL